ncbi:TlyA family RNA methyltransferase [Nesterenkonia suensis]
MTSERLDRALITRGLAPSRSRAGQLIGSGAVTVDGRTVTKVSTPVRPHQSVQVAVDDPWVSRAAHKLLGALDSCPEIAVAGRRCLDAGASTGGFTQVLLERGAAHVVAVDVGHDQLATLLREDRRVENHEGLNLRHLRADELGEPFSLIVADLSFISLRLVTGTLAAQAAPGADLLLMVKPQFEVGRGRLGRTGVVTSPELRREAVVGVVDSARQHGLTLLSAHRSPLPGQDGNREFFVHLRRPDDVPNSPSREVSAQAARLEQVDYHD